MKKLMLSSFIIVFIQVCSFPQVANHLVLAELYGGGGDQGSYWINDYIILYNPTSSTVDLSTWSIQYAKFNGSTWEVTNLNSSIPANSYYFIQLGSGGKGIAPLPFTPNVVSTTNIEKNKGKIALVNSQAALTVSNPVGSPNVIDFIGYGNGTNAFEGSGPALQLALDSGLRRKDNSGNNTYGTNGNGWDTDDNAGDFYEEIDLVNNPPLPVELCSFSAVIKDKVITLKWRTETEVNNYGFEVQRSEFGVQSSEFISLGFVEGYGNSNSPKEYSFVDKSVGIGKYSYRLRQIDNDGSFTYSKIIELNLNTPMKYNLSQNYPNPFNPTTTISFTIPRSQNVTLKIFNSLGEEVTVITDGFLEAGVHTFNFKPEEVTSGMYIYNLSTEEVTLTKKMLLLK